MEASWKIQAGMICSEGARLVKFEVCRAAVAQAGVGVARSGDLQREWATAQKS